MDVDTKKDCPGRNDQSYKKKLNRTDKNKILKINDCMESFQDF